MDSFRMKYALTRTERKRLIRETTVYALVLFEHYLRIASTDDVLITDQGAAEYFDWSVSTAKRWRLALVKAGWYLHRKSKSTSGDVVNLYYLGKDEVAAASREAKSLSRRKVPLRPKLKQPDVIIEEQDLL